MTEMQPPCVIHPSAPGPFDNPQYNYHNFSSNNDEQYEIGEQVNVKESFQTLEKRLKVVEGDDILGDAAMDMCLVSYLVIPTKFKTHDFEKYKGHTCTRSHLVMYFRKMVAHTKNDKLLIHCF